MIIILKKIFNTENEFTKKWMARFTKVVFFLLIFYVFFSQELLYFYFKFGLSENIMKIFFVNYTGFAKILITGYAVTFITSMGKAYLAKQQEEKNKLIREERDINEQD